MLIVVVCNFLYQNVNKVLVFLEKMAVILLTVVYSRRESCCYDKIYKNLEIERIKFNEAAM